MTIAVVGWGSLVWNPGSLDIEPRWYPDGPTLPIEFARVSLGNRLTLVLVEDAPLQPTQWAASRKATLEEAVEDLRVREGTGAKWIGHWSPAGGPSDESLSAEVVASWAESKGLDGVVWTTLGPKAPSGERILASAAERLEYLKGLVAEGKEGNAREYIENAPPQIETPFRALVRRELGWGRK